MPTSSHDPLAVAVVVLDFLSQVDLGPHTDPEEVAKALDDVAVSCSPHRDLAVNPAKMLAIALADATPLVWGGSVLAARAGRRVAEAMRQASGRTALAADAEHLLPVIRGAGQDSRKDIFADPFEDGPAELRPTLIILDDGSEETTIRMTRSRLLAEAEQNGVRHRILECHDGGPVSRYASLLTRGQYAAVYLGLGLGRTARADA
jgi:hypothetical protein